MASGQVSGSGQGPQFQPMDGTNQTGSASGPDNGGTFISGDALLKLYEFRAAHVQSRINSLFEQMQTSQNQSDALNAVQAKLAQYAGGITKDADYDDLNSSISSAIGKLPVGDPVRLQLEQLQQSGTMTTDGHGGQDKALSADEMKSMTTTVDGIQKTVDTDNSKVGINLNVFMGQLSELSSLFSNSIEALHQTMMAPINNIKS